MKKYQIQMREHYGMDLHNYYETIVFEKELEKLKERGNKCVGHTYDCPKDTLVKIVKELTPPYIKYEERRETK